MLGTLPRLGSMTGAFKILLMNVRSSGANFISSFSWCTLWLVEGGLGFPCAASPKQNPTCRFPASGSPERFAIAARQTLGCSSFGYGSSNHALLNK